ncbi:MAG TPA: HNH endonuclease signature motif containing protein [Blastocatellia bacterium]|jgi:5-methylcytosine-specific restriction endonuclease McrA|nr:HNH endonuclease signature motif containing protein [Blastocatellia bacterium]
MPKERAAAAQRRKILVRAKWRCEYCGVPEPFVPDPFAVEHIIPSSKGGKTRLNNLASACLACNGRKYNKVAGLDPLTQELAPLFNPRKQRWQDHFTWSKDGLLIVGLTPTGRATVETLKVNQQKIVNLRRILVLAGLRPPKE